jgi:hypothetical protein
VLISIRFCSALFSHTSEQRRKKKKVDEKRKKKENKNKMIKMRNDKEKRS